jgi:hypothetical protein
MRPFDRAQAERNVRALQDRRATDLGSPAVPDLSAEAIRLRHEQEGEGKNATGRQLTFRAARVLAQANKLQQTVQRRGLQTRRGRRASEQADEALRTAAVQIRIAGRVPLDRGYLHALSVQQIQAIEEEVGRAFEADPAALAVDTHRRIRELRIRIKATPDQEDR